MVTVYDVASAAGLSIASVSRALNSQPGVSRTTAERVQRIANELGYEPNDVARSLVAKSTRTIALLLPDIANPFFPELVKGVQSAVDAHEHMLLLVDGADSHNRVASSMAGLRRKQVDGVIVVAGSLDQSMDELFAGIPTVFLDRETQGHGASVGVDHELGAYSATEFLINCGHRRIGHIAGPEDVAVAQLRLNGWRRACEQAGIAADDTLVRRGDFSEDGGFRAGSELLAMHPDCSAVFAANDLSAIGFLSLCAQRGLAVPGDMSVIGFDGINLARYTTPRLATVVQPAAELGQTAATILLDHIQGNASTLHVLLPTRIDPGASVAQIEGDLL